MKMTEGTLRALSVVLPLPGKLFGKGYGWIDLAAGPLAFEDPFKFDVHQVDFKGRVQKKDSGHEPYRLEVGYISTKRPGDNRPWGREDVNVMHIIGPTKVLQTRLFCIDLRGRIRFRRIDLTRA
ncbi:hypothetical protein HY971_04235 [Candidatus Kaiserbacteria bacterium]|nr:hypothetical protein [Candidatus Kaiserbacteria bacterium]